MQHSENTRGRVWRKIVYSRQYYLMLLLPVVYVLLFNYAPMYGVLMAFQRFSVTKGIMGSPWIGLENFRQFFSTPSSLKIIGNTLNIGIYSLWAGFPFPILLAIALNEVGSKWYRKTVQLVSYLPYFVSTVVVVGIIMQITDLRSGLLNRVIKVFGGQAINFMSQPKLFDDIYVWSGIWQATGYSAIIYLAALAGVSRELQEAALIDGASRLQRIWHVDLPCIRQQVLMIFIFSVAGVLGVGFEKAFLLQTTLNLSASEVIATFVYKVGLINADYGFSAAVGLTNTLVSILLLLITNFIVKRLSDVGIW